MLQGIRHLRLFHVDWYDYDVAQFSEIRRREGSDGPRGAVWESQDYDAFGRLTTWKTDRPGERTNDRVLTYDGLGRLVAATDAATGDLRDLDYDAANQLVLERRGPIDGPGSDESIHRFDGDRYDAVSGSRIEQVLPLLRVQDGDLRIALLDQDGHALGLYDDAGAELRFEVAGAFGGSLDDGGGVSAYWQGTPWPVDGVHGGEPDHEAGWVQRGQRHAMLDDGRWLQPEPLLAMGRMSAFPRGASGVYAAGNPVDLGDITGLEPNKFGATNSSSAGRTIDDLGIRTIEDWGRVANSPERALTEQQLGEFERNRYVFTTRAGWVDLRHVAASAEVAESTGSPAVAEMLGAGLEGAQLIAGAVFRNEDAAHSAFSVEELPSNAVGAQFPAFAEANTSSTLGENLAKYLDELGAVEPEASPDFESLPQDDITKRNGLPKVVIASGPDPLGYGVQ